ncbi:MAG: UbiX family flavin prenyltransferase [Epsilonproteobacteria bacterium]|nr:UbiX family flavin prenyltransferase [Campylobacterota bacterium]
MKRIIVGISGASGVIYGIRMLEVLSSEEVEVHLIVTEAAKKIAGYEHDITYEKIKLLAKFCHSNDDIAAPIASGSFATEGMIIVPCSIKTLSGIANSYSDNLMIRAADVCLKERRKLILMVRETPLHLGHIELMAKVTRTGGIIVPPVPSFYHKPKSIDDIINQTIGKILDLFGIDHNLFKRWE